MATLMDIRDTLALQGRLEATQLSQQLTLPLPLVMAMLMRLEAMGKAQRIIDNAHGSLTGSCKSCPESKGCIKELWMLRE